MDGVTPTSRVVIPPIGESLHSKPVGIRMQTITDCARLSLTLGLATVTAAAVITAMTLGSGVAVGIAVVTTLALTLLCIGRCYHQIRHSLPKPLKRMGDIIAAQVIDFIACCALGALVVNPFKRKDPKVVSPDAGRPILMVHGYLGHSSNWTYPRSRIEEANLGPVFTINLGHPFQSIDKDYAELVKEKAEEIKRITGRSDLILVGHSMGGVVSAYYATHLAEPGTVTEIITIGSPLNGTHLAPYGVGKCAQQMRLNSDLLRDIHDKLEERSDIHVLNLSSETDQFILPNHSALLDESRLKGRLKKHTFDKMGHATYLFSDTVGDILVNYIKSATSTRRAGP